MHIKGNLLATQTKIYPYFNVFSKSFWMCILGIWVAQAACIKKLTPLQPSIQLFWSANHEKAVNSPGGGYRVYYSQTPGFDITTASWVDVPYQSGLNAPTSTTIPNLSPGSYYIKVVAYAALPSVTRTQPPSIQTTAGTQSAPSIEIKTIIQNRGPL